MTDENNRPVKRYQAGAVSGALWKNKAQMNDGSSGEFMSLTLDRRFKDKDGTWRSSASLRANDIPKAILVLTKAYEHMVTKASDQGEEKVADEPTVIEELVQ